MRRIERGFLKNGKGAFADFGGLVGRLEKSYGNRVLKRAGGRAKSELHIPGRDAGVSLFPRRRNLIERARGDGRGGERDRDNLGDLKFIDGMEDPVDDICRAQVRLT